MLRRSRPARETLMRYMSQCMERRRKDAVDRSDVSLAHVTSFLPLEEKGPGVPTTRSADASSVGCPLRSTGRRIADRAEGSAYTGWQR